MENIVNEQSGRIEFKELIKLLWRKKWLLIIPTFLFAILSVLYALSLPNEYRSSTIVIPSDNKDMNGLGALANQFGGLASIAGINLNAGESMDSTIAMKLIKTWGFSEYFIKKHDLAVPLFAANGWDRNNKEILIDNELYDIKAKKWVRKPPPNKTIEPTSWELYEIYDKRVSVGKDKETGLITISVVHYSPELAKQWVDWIVQDINSHMRNKSLAEATKNINYLEQQMMQTSVAEIRSVFSQLIQEQHKSKMLAEVSDEYVFKTVSPARASEKKYKPKRAFIAILGTFIGGILGLLIIFGMTFSHKFREVIKD